MAEGLRLEGGQGFQELRSVQVLSVVRYRISGFRSGECPIAFECPHENPLKRDTAFLMPRPVILSVGPDDPGQIVILPH